MQNAVMLLGVGMGLWSYGCMAHRKTAETANDPSELWEQLQTSNGAIDSRVRYELARIGNSAASYLLSQLSTVESNSDAAQCAVDVLGYMGYVGSNGVELIFKAVEDPDVRVRTGAIRACQRMGWKGNRAIPRLIRCLRARDQPDNVRRFACIALDSIVRNTHGLYLFVGEFAPDKAAVDASEVILAGATAALALGEAAKDASTDVASVAQAALIAVQRQTGI